MSELEVFRDLTLRGPAGSRPQLRAALIAKATAPWRHAAEKQEKARSVSGGDDVLVFEHDASGGLAAAGLFLWRRDDGYAITNIVPMEVGELGRTAYNALLDDFRVRIAEPAAREVGYQVEVTGARQTLEDWVPKHVADALKRFSTLANKSTGSSHPFDQKRWFEFLIAMHELDDSDLDGSRLMRWLVEIEHWSEDRASDLISEFEFARDLLRQYDKHLGL